jgi:Dihaem cytochrome c
MTALHPTRFTKLLMKMPYRTIVLSVLALGFTTVVLDNARAGGGPYFAPVSDRLVKEECGSCQLAYPPSMLPARSWARMMTGLSNHFSTDASLEAKTAEQIRRYLIQNAADTGGRQYGEKLMRGIPQSNAPLRITELPQWMRKHRKVPDWEWTHKDVRTKAN